jgi:hypothetical protein
VILPIPLTQGLLREISNLSDARPLMLGHDVIVLGNGSGPVMETLTPGMRWAGIEEAK